MLLQSEIYSSYRLKQKSAYSILEKRLLKKQKKKKLNCTICHPKLSLSWNIIAITILIMDLSCLWAFSRVAIHREGRDTEVNHLRVLWSPDILLGSVLGNHCQFYEVLFLCHYLISYGYIHKTNTNTFTP